MIAACPKCGARYRIEQHRIKPEGVRLRCVRCSAAFRVRAPAPRSPERPAPAPQAPAQQPAREPDRSRLVVVADSDPERAKRTAAALIREGIEVVLAHDGVEAILTIQRVMPRAVILDAGLPRMFGFQICELMKRNESLRSIQVLLVGSVHHPERYRRPPDELYGADAYLEQPQLPEAAVAELRRLGVPVSSQAAVQPVTDAPARSEAPPPDPDPRPGASDAAPRLAPTAPPARPHAAARETGGRPVGGDTSDPEIAKAERLARIIVSDIVLYNEQKFAAAVARGNVLQVMDSELEEGRSLFRERIPARIREQRDFLRDEMVRVARQRGTT